MLILCRPTDQSLAIFVSELMMTTAAAPARRRSTVGAGAKRAETMTIGNPDTPTDFHVETMVTAT